MKLPVVSTHVTGIPEIVEHGVEGLLVAPGDVQALAAALRRLMQDPELRRTLGERGRKKVEQKFDIERNVQQFVRLFSGGLPVQTAASRHVPAEAVRQTGEAP